MRISQHRSNHHEPYVLSQTPRRVLQPLTPVRLLDLVKIFLAFTPEVEFPDEKISLDEKVIFSVCGGFVFLLAQLPLYGLKPGAALEMADPFAALRPVFALEQGTLLELGLLPAITAAFVWQVAAGSRWLKTNLSYVQDRELFQTGQKITALVIATAFAAALIASGYYDGVVRATSAELEKAVAAGTPFAPSLGNYGLLFLQIVGWNFLLTLVIEIIDKGYGFGLGVMCLLALNAATSVVRDVVGMEAVAGGDPEKPQTYGVVAYLIKSLFSMDFGAIRTALVAVVSRAGAPTIWSVLAVVAVGLASIAVQNIRVELPVRSSKARGTANIYPIRMVYTGALPVLFALTVLANVQVATYFGAIFARSWNPVVAHVLESVSLHVSAPTLIAAAATAPLRLVSYLVLLVALATAFAPFWANISGLAPKDIAKQFKEQSVIIAGKRDASVAKELGKVIPVAARTGAFVLAAIVVVGETLGLDGKAAAVVIGINAAFAVLEEFMSDLQQSGGASQIMNSLAAYR